MATPHKLVNGQVVPLSAEEIAQRQAEETAWNNGSFDRAMADLRSKRDRLLASCDYTVLQDSTYTDEQVAEWVTYRQALRDITENLTTVEQVNNITWPTKP
jgi:hypothetical protein